MSIERVLVVHNFYQQPGGEDQVFAMETDLLRRHGHEVMHYTLDNHAIVEMSRLTAARFSVWNSDAYRAIRRLIRERRPQVMHCHNLFPLISPAAYAAARAEGVPVVQTLHNYRLMCLNPNLLRNGRVCEDCVGRSVPWPGVLHACYRGSRQASAVAATTLTVHRALRTWRTKVDVYIAPSEFVRRKQIEGGLPAAKVVVKPNFMDPDPGVGAGDGGYALFVGRLSVEKGIVPLLEAWQHLGDRLPLRIVGDGPLRETVTAAARDTPGITWLGPQPHTAVLTLMQEATCLLFPSQCYEGAPMVLVEAYAAGLPVVASNLGSMATMVIPGRTGFLVRPGDPADLAARIDWILSHPEELAGLRQGARAEYEMRYSAEANYRRLIEIYEMAGAPSIKVRERA